MKRPENKNWLDDALAEAIGSEESKPNFEKWKQTHSQAVEMLTSRASRQHPASKSPPNIWRIIMKSPVTKLAAAAVIIIALFVFLQIPSEPMAYAFQDTIEAYSSIRWLHIREFETIGQETRTADIWLRCNDQGNIMNMRFESDYVGEPVGPLIITSSSDSAQAWLSKHNLKLIGYGNASVLLRFDVSELDPKFLFQKLFEQQHNGQVTVDIHEPQEKSEPVIVTVTYPQGSRSENWQKVFSIDQATKLVVKIDKYKRRNKEFEYVKTLEFFDYNQPIDPMMFTLDGETPADAHVVDMTEVEAGLSQDDMTDQEIAVEVIRQFFEAVIVKDFRKAGQLYLAAPDFLVEQAFMGANIIEIISVGPAYPDPDPDSKRMLGSCKALAEFDGQYYEIDAPVINIVPVDNGNRWLLCGIFVNVNPASGTLTLSRDGADLSAVTYDRLEPGELMQKWLILEPIRIEVRGDTLFPSEETQRNEFAANHINVSRFEPKVTIGEKDYEWLVLECDYGTINLTTKYKDWYLITYAWAQIVMPEEKQGILGIGSDDGVKVWVNGELVHENLVSRGVGIDNDRVPVILKKGMNQLVLKIQNQGGPWGFCCRLLDE